MEKALIAAIEDLTKSIKDLIESVDSLRGRQMETFDQNVEMGDRFCSLENRLKELAEAIKKRL
jgi:uncharacterized protein YoxC